MPFDTGLARLTRDECMALLAGVSFARVGISVDALPAILPVTIALSNESVIFRTVPGTKLAMAASGAILAVEADHYDAGFAGGWSVLVRGVASEITDPRENAQARELLADSWMSNEALAHFVRVQCDLVTGRRLEPSSTLPHPTAPSAEDQSPAGSVGSSVAGPAENRDRER
jgi:nitroimidazol reductase NimA-like FMN-containing flavoprotein (pyridoxamine 5'-phosphate oxidase superfamily)